METPLHVNNCHLCEIYTKDKLPNKVFFLCEEFILFQDSESNTAVVSTCSHITSVNRGQWGRILYRVRRQFGQNIKLIKKPSRFYPDDHWHLYVTITNEK